MTRLIVLVAVALSTTLPLHAQQIQFVEVESAPNNGLAWLAAQQKDNGSWQTEKMAASRKTTSLSLLAFLAAGDTHKEGKYKLTVDKGLKFLGGVTKDDAQKARGGEINGHALATIALCESYSMTQDKQLVIPAQQSIDLLVRAQNEDGGWGSQPNKASTTLDIGWPVMALTSGRLAGLKVTSEAVEGVTRFLDRVQANGGAYYGLAKPGKRSDTTSIGLLCRLLSGAKHDDPGIKEGLRYLVTTGPSATDLDFNYFTTLALCGSDTAKFASWNRKFQEQSLKAQVKADEDKGSWGPIGKQYGQVEATAMNLLCLQVYYRHLPLHLELFSGD